MTTYATRSDRRYKKEITPLMQDERDLLQRFLQLQPVSYFPNPATLPVDDPDRKRFGFIANDVEKLFPNLVINAGAPPEIARGLEYDGFIPILVAVVQHQQQLLEQQQAISRKQQTEITQLRQQLATLQQTVEHYKNSQLELATLVLHLQQQIEHLQQQLKVVQSQQ